MCHIIRGYTITQWTIIHHVTKCRTSSEDVHHLTGCTTCHKMQKYHMSTPGLDFIESSWLCGNTLASDANGPGYTPGGTLELDPGYHIFVGR